MRARATWRVAALPCGIALALLASPPASSVDPRGGLGTSYQCRDDGESRFCHCSSYLDCELMRKQACKDRKLWGCKDGTFFCTCEWKAKKGRRPTAPRASGKTVEEKVAPSPRKGRPKLRMR